MNVEAEVRDRQVRVWAILMVATCLTAVVGLEERDGSAWVAIALLGIAFVKVRLVVRWFMEVRHAPRALRWALDAYVGVVLTTLIVLYLVI